MSAKTKIVVLHMKELIYTAVFAALGIALILLLVFLFGPGKEQQNSSGTNSSGLEENVDGEESSDTGGADATEDSTGKESSDQYESTDDNENSGENALSASSESAYIPGVYTTSLVLNDQTIDVQVIVDQNTITSVQLVNLTEAVTTMYPLLEPALEYLCEQIYEQQSLEGITYQTESKYTSLVLLEAIRSALENAMVSDEGN